MRFGMTKREVAYLLIGLGIGLMMSVALVIEMAFWFHRVFIVGFAWRPASFILLMPLVSIFVGIFILINDRNKRFST
jgi:hypothetical protein